GLRRGNPLCQREELNSALHAHRETDARRRLTPKLRNEAVVTAARAYGILGAEGVRNPLEDGSGVIVEPADQARIHLVGHTDVRQALAECIEVLPGLGIQMVRQ